MSQTYRYKPLMVLITETWVTVQKGLHQWAWASTWITEIS